MRAMAVMYAAATATAATSSVEECSTMGFGHSTTCKECHEVDDQSRTACLGCCIARATFPQMQMQDITPGFSVVYKRGRLPTMLFYDDLDELQESVIVATWDQSSLDAYLALHLKPAGVAAQALGSDEL
ncbi:hypothetical protein H257_17690 [Aphanomyces astaci]|uniref:Uncharacterized protein n=1 Tax=Aphanomyces astaci TaxID=112090 RepID=W4FFJ1_APHAT|nr:hypothetical protein H257_17690 [Aphanomyces astaci]ETV65634.1 hypothetical protein H257_17690 [Aphanomyces astaci]|eukprot:XP_009844873.1 hypothetical protein H257_17690 [Aphanomyces astaci]